MTFPLNFWHENQYRITLIYVHKSKIQFNKKKKQESRDKEPMKVENNCILWEMFLCLRPD